MLIAGCIGLIVAGFIAGLAFSLIEIERLKEHSSWLKNLRDLLCMEADRLDFDLKRAKKLIDAQSALIGLLDNPPKQKENLYGRCYF